MIRRGELSMKPPDATGHVAEQVPHWMHVLIGLPSEAYSRLPISSTKDIPLSGGAVLAVIVSVAAALICCWPFAFRRS